MVTRYGKLKLGIVYQFTYMLVIYNNNNDNNNIIIINSSNNNNNNNNNKYIYIYVIQICFLRENELSWTTDPAAEAASSSVEKETPRRGGCIEWVECVKMCDVLNLSLHWHLYIYIYLLYLIICWCSYYNPWHIYIYKCILMYRDVCTF
jgi:hypothetical protein